DEESFWVGPTTCTTGWIALSNYLRAAWERGTDALCMDTRSNVLACSAAGEFPASCLANSPGTNSVWFYFIAEETQAAVSTEFNQTDFITEMMIYEAPENCENLTTLGDELGCSADGSDIMLSDLNVGSTYYIKVSGANNDAGV